jgi:hypothetical protein
MRESVWCFAGGLTGKQKYLDVTSNFYETISKQASNNKISYKYLFCCMIKWQRLAPIGLRKSGCKKE